MKPVPAGSPCRYRFWTFRGLCGAFFQQEKEHGMLSPRTKRVPSILQTILPRLFQSKGVLSLDGATEPCTDYDRRAARRLSGLRRSSGCKNALSRLPRRGRRLFSERLVLLSHLRPGTRCPAHRSEPAPHRQGWLSGPRRLELRLHDGRGTQPRGLLYPVCRQDARAPAAQLSRLSQRGAA